MSASAERDHPNRECSNNGHWFCSQFCGSAIWSLFCQVGLRLGPTECTGMSDIAWQVGWRWEPLEVSGERPVSAPQS